MAVDTLPVIRNICRQVNLSHLCGLVIVASGAGVLAVGFQVAGLAGEVTLSTVIQPEGVPG